MPATAWINDRLRLSWVCCCVIIPCHLAAPSGCSRRIYVFECALSKYRGWPLFVRLNVPQAAQRRTNNACGDPCATFGQAVARRRQKLGLSQTQLASRLGSDKLGVTQGYISELEAGRKNPTLTTMSAIAGALQVHLSKLVEADVAPSDAFAARNPTPAPLQIRD